MDSARNAIRKILSEAQAEGEGETGQRYPNVGGDAQPEVQEAIRRYKEMSPEERGKEPLLYWLLGSGTPPYKDSREATEYTDTSETEGQTCGNCSFTYFRTATQQFICSQIRGVIQPGGWCNRWEESEPVEPVDVETGV